MDLSDKIAALALRIAKQKDMVDTEEATKNAFIMPFLSLLGYDVFDPTQVIPEFTADVGVKKGEKVDYAIKLNGKIVLLIECKPCKQILNRDHASQLFRYFSVTEARFALLTNGIQYWFYTDLDEPNKMDTKPFFELDLLAYRPSQIEELKKFFISNFDVQTILATASDLKYGSLFTREIIKELESPSEDFLKMIISRVYDGKLIVSVMQKFVPLVQKSLKDTVRELVNQRLSSALDDSTLSIPSDGITNGVPTSSSAPEVMLASEEIVTTGEEIDGYLIVKAIVRDLASANRIQMRDAKTYCAVLFDNNNRKPICRLHLNRQIKYLGIFDADKNEEKIKIDSLDDIFLHASRLRETVSLYLASN